MQWFKHDLDALTDAKLKKLVMRYHETGYAIYFHCLELITGDLGLNHITFELEHDAEIIADDLHIQGTKDKSAVEIVNEVMRYIVELGLFECSDNRIFCFKMLKRLDTSMTSTPKMRKMIADAKDNHDSIMIVSCKKRIEENRIDKNRKEERAPVIYGKLENVKLSPEEYSKLVDEYGEDIAKDYIDRLSLWIPNASRRVKSCYATLLNWIRRDKIPKLIKPLTCSLCGATMLDGICGNKDCPQYN